MSYIMVVPIVDAGQFAGFLDGMKIPRENILVVDNGIPAVWPDWDGRYANGNDENWGVATSWNVGVKAIREEGIDWLVIASSALRWGPAGGLDFVGGLDSAGSDVAVATTLGWHLCAIHRDTFDIVGTFDENFYPGYYEETDFLYRMAMADLPSPRENGRHWGFVECDSEYGDASHALKIKHVDEEVQMNFLNYLYQRKWGGKPGAELYTTPWGLPNYPIWKWPAR